MQRRDASGTTEITPKTFVELIKKITALFVTRAAMELSRHYLKQLVQIISCCLRCCYSYIEQQRHYWHNSLLPFPAHLVTFLPKRC